MAKQKTRAELEAENKILKTKDRIDSVTKLLRTLLIVGGLMFCIDRVSAVGIEWAGKTTAADINLKADVKALTNLNHIECDCPEAEVIYEVAPYSWVIGLLGFLFGSVGIAYGRGQSTLRRDAIERLHPYNRELENVIDGRRSSSGLTPRGQTRPEDE